MEELAEDECRRLLAERPLGRLAIPDDLPFTWWG